MPWHRLGQPMLTRDNPEAVPLAPDDDSSNTEDRDPANMHVVDQLGTTPSDGDSSDGGDNDLDTSPPNPV